MGGPLPVSPLLFHPNAKGSQIVMDATQKTVKRQASFCNAITFSNSPFAAGVELCVWASPPKTRPGSTRRNLPKYACPDTGVTRAAFWAKALPEEFADEGNVIAFWVDKKGRVFYRINQSSPMLFFSGVRIAEPLWALIDVYGLTRGVQLLGKSTKCLFLSELPQLPAVLSAAAVSESDLHFHQLRGAHIKTLDEQTAARSEHGREERTLVFTNRPLRTSETVFVKVTKSSPARLGSLSYGVTSCDPAALRPSDLPHNPEALVDRKEFWAVCRWPRPAERDILGFTVNQDGEVLLKHNGVNVGMQVCVDNSHPLWMFFGLHGAVTQLRILGKFSAKYMELFSRSCEIHLTKVRIFCCIFSLRSSVVSNKSQTGLCCFLPALVSHVSR
uniref:Neuralized E3 ubiquitin protein ligase 1Aa n=1 Tax=Sphaeramia orbicularis TaxID=375764 RepID=A0A673AX72_9TELE